MSSFLGTLKRDVHSRSCSLIPDAQQMTFQVNRKNLFALSVGARGDKRQVPGAPEQGTPQRSQHMLGHMCITIGKAVRGYAVMPEVALGRICASSSASASVSTTSGLFESSGGDEHAVLSPPSLQVFRLQF